MRILINDKMQSAVGIPSEIISPALSDRYSVSSTITAVFSVSEIIDCIGLGYTDADTITVRNDNPFGAAVVNYPLVSDSVDISGNGNDGTDTDITWTDGVANFNGTSSKIVLPFSGLNVDSWSIAVKFNFASLTNNQSIIRLNNAGSSESFIIRKDIDVNLIYYASSDGVNYDIANGIGVYSSLVVSTEYMLVVTFDGTAYRFYLNNTLVKTITTTSKILVPTDLIIGSYGSTTYFTGTMSNFYIFDRNLTDEEITSLYNGDMLQSVSIPSQNKNGLYLLNQIDGSRFTITHNGTYIGRIGIGQHRKLGTAPTKELGFFTTNESRRTLSGQVIAGAGGYCGRTIDVDVRYKIDEDVYSDIESAYVTQISREYPYFLMFDDEQHKFPDSVLHFYASTDKPISKLQSSSYKFLYSYKFKFEEAF